MSLTKHREGSLGELCKISFPLMFSSLSVMAMLFVDRILLAQYSLQAFNAAVSATTLGWAFLLGWLTLTNISEVFVAQYNGQGENQKLGRPVWQMIWVGIASSLFFIPMALWGDSYIFNCPLQCTYFRWMMYFGPFFAIYGALGGYFVGQGKVILVTTLTVIANFVNAGLDWLLIFGWEGWIPSMGVKGAAIATCSTQLLQVSVLLLVFLNKNHRERCGTGNFRIDKALLLRCLKVGSPHASFMLIEILGWSVYYLIMANISERHITVAGIVQSIIIMLYFFAEGLGKGTATVVGNLIGAKKQHLVFNTIKAGVRLQAIFFFTTLILLVGFSDHLSLIFLDQAQGEQLVQYREAIPICMLSVALYLFFEGLMMIYTGVLTAAGDTFFLMVTGAFAVWIFHVLPIYIAVVHFGASIEVASFMCVGYAFINWFIKALRVRSGKWKTLQITDTKVPSWT